MSRVSMILDKNNTKNYAFSGRSHRGKGFYIYHYYDFDTNKSKKSSEEKNKEICPGLVSKIKEKADKYDIQCHRERGTPVYEVRVPFPYGDRKPKKS